MINKNINTNTINMALHLERDLKFVEVGIDRKGCSLGVIVR